MAYIFTIDNQKFIGYTIPAASPMRIATESSKQFSDPFLADFIPDSDALLSDNPTGRWANIQPDTDIIVLEKLKPEVLAACRRRRLNILKLNLGLPQEHHPEWLEKSGDKVLAHYQRNRSAIHAASLDLIAKTITP